MAKIKEIPLGDKRPSKLGLQVASGSLHSQEHTHVHTQICVCRQVEMRYSLFHLLPVSLVFLCCLVGNFLFPPETKCRLLCWRLRKRS